ncbi:MAG: hypothetical protein GF350_01855 [Chitinivibrionales bacterium]|nr:hypothetical protein [Chitinivibrionales bacterium]
MINPDAIRPILADSQSPGTGPRRLFILFNWKAAHSAMSKRKSFHNQKQSIFRLFSACEKVAGLALLVAAAAVLSGSDKSTEGYTDWESLWNERVAALESVLGPHKDVYPATLPLYLGGTSDIVSFPEHRGGIAYATGSLTGSGDQIQNRMGEYELVVCIKESAAWAPKLLSNLSKYTLKAAIEPGAIMDVRKSMPQPGTITSFLFIPYARFELQGKQCGLLLCLGITDAELQYLKNGKVSDLVKKLKEKGIYPFTDTGRGPVVE